MKYYHSREELKNDVDFIKHIVIDKEKCSQLVSQLFDHWMHTAPDSPFNDIDDTEVIFARELVKFNKLGISSEWDGEHIVYEDISPKKDVRSRHYNLRKL